MSKPIYEPVKPRVIKRDDRQDRENYMYRHEQSLLEILIARNPERAKLIIEKLSQQRPRVA